MTVDNIDYENRDPNNLNGYVRVWYQDVIAEPEPSSFSIDCVWKNAFCCYTCSKNCCYKFLTALFAIPISLFWGCAFGITTFYQIWCCMPILRCNFIVLRCIRMYISVFVAMFIAPYFEIIGLLLSRIHVTTVDSVAPRPYMERLYSYEEGISPVATYRKPWTKVYRQDVVVMKKKPAPPPPKKVVKQKKEKVVNNNVYVVENEQRVLERPVEYVEQPEPVYQQTVVYQKPKESVSYTVVDEPPVPQTQPVSRYAYYYESEKVAKPPPPPTVVKQTHVVHHYDSYDQIPTHSSTNSEQIRMPNRSYKPRPHYFEKTESYRHKSQSHKKIEKVKYQSVSYYESDYYSPYRRPDNMEYINRKPVNIKDRPKWKI